MKIRDIINEENIKDVLTTVLIQEDENEVLPRFVKALILNPLSNNESNITNVDNVSYIVAVEFQKYLQINEKVKTSEELLTAKQDLKANLDSQSSSNLNIDNTGTSTSQDYNQNQVKAGSEWNAAKFMNQANEGKSSNNQVSKGDTTQTSINTQNNSFQSAEIVYKAQLQALKVYQANIWKRTVDNVLLQLSNPIDFNDDSVKRPWFLNW